MLTVPAWLKVVFWMVASVPEVLAAVISTSLAEMLVLLNEMPPGEFTIRAPVVKFAPLLAVNVPPVLFRKMPPCVAFKFSPMVIPEPELKVIWEAFILPLSEESAETVIEVPESRATFGAVRKELLRVKLVPASRARVVLVSVMLALFKVRLFWGEVKKSNGLSDVTLEPGWKTKPVPAANSRSAGELMKETVLAKVMLCAAPIPNCCWEVTGDRST